MTNCSTADGVAPPRARPVGHHQAGVDEAAPLVLAVEHGRARRRSGPSRPAPDRPPRGDRWSTPGAHPPGPGRRRRPGSRRPRRGAARVASRPLEVEVGVVLQVKPMPPSSCTQSLALSTQPLKARAAAVPPPQLGLVGATASNGRRRVPRHEVICSTRTSTSASRCLTPGIGPIGARTADALWRTPRPVSRHQRAPPATSAAARATATGEPAHWSATELRRTGYGHRSGRHPPTPPGRVEALDAGGPPRRPGPRRRRAGHETTEPSPSAGRQHDQRGWVATRTADRGPDTTMGRRRPRRGCPGGRRGRPAP